MMGKAILEICAFNAESCFVAERCGAARVELCADPFNGGTTPSYGTIKLVRENVSIKLYPIIRPRPGNFFYSDEEIAIMKSDIEICRQLACDGISVGISTIGGEIDTEKLKRIVEWAGPMEVTCHRVFDSVPDPFKALEDIISCGCVRILTSGLKSAAPEGVVLLKQLVEKAGNKIIIMPGAGVKSSNIAALRNATGASEFHSSARKAAPNNITYFNKDVTDYGTVFIADESEVKAMVEALNK